MQLWFQPTRAKDPLAEPYALGNKDYDERMLLPVSGIFDI